MPLSLARGRLRRRLAAPAEAPPRPSATPPDHPALRAPLQRRGMEGNVRGPLASAGRRCILLRQPSPVRWSPPGGAGEMSPHHPQPPPTQATLHLQAAPPASRPDQRSEPPRTVGEQRPISSASRPDQRFAPPCAVGEERPVTPADSAGPATFPSSQEGWPKAGVVGPRRPSGRCRHLLHRLCRQAQKVVVDKACRWRAG